MGPKGPRAQIILELKRSQQLTAKDLAARLAMSLNAVRHHLKELEAEGLIEYDRQHRGVGAPVFAYRLSPRADALFPRRYEAMLLELLERVATRDGREAVTEVLEAYYGARARQLQAMLVGAPAGRRLEVVARARLDDGYMAEAHGIANDGSATLTEHNCAIKAVAEQFPEICAAEQRFLEQVLGAVVERRAHILGGCAACEYYVRFAEAAETRRPEETA